MAEDKAPYKLVVKLDSARPDAIGQALGQLRDIASDYDTTGKGEAQVSFESYQERTLKEICDAFEEWLYKHAIGLGCKMRIDRPGLRPEMLSVFRERQHTPMDDQGWEGAEEEQELNESLITPPPRELLALPAPRYELTVDDGTYTFEDADAAA
jgi:hypothetical protein